VKRQRSFPYLRRQLMRQHFSTILQAKPSRNSQDARCAQMTTILRVLSSANLHCSARDVILRREFHQVVDGERRAGRLPKNADIMPLITPFHVSVVGVPKAWLEGD